MPVIFLGIQKLVGLASVIDFGEEIFVYTIVDQNPGEKFNLFKVEVGQDHVLRCLQAEKWLQSSVKFDIDG